MPGAPATPFAIQHLQLNCQHHSNPHFDSWTLTRDILTDRTEIPLAAPIALNSPEDLDYVHARYDALNNHITVQPHHSYIFTQSTHTANTTSSSTDINNSIQLCTLNTATTTTTSITPLCTIPRPTLPPTDSQILGSQLHPSIVEVITTPNNNTTSEQPPPSSPSSSLLLLVSYGLGDIRLVTIPPPPSLQQQHTTSTIASSFSPSAPSTTLLSSDVIFPLRPSPPLRGIRPLKLEAAMQLADDSILLICWAVAKGVANSPAVCQVYAITLNIVVVDDDGGSGSGGSELLEVVSIQLLKCCSMPPHAVLTNPITSSILLAIDPKDNDTSSTTNTTATINVIQPHNNSNNNDNGNDDDDDSDAVSPRTLAALVERLEHYTTDEPAYGVPNEGFSDLFHETGPDNVGAMGTEPACTLLVYTVREQGQLQTVQHVSCLPHRVLTCQLHQDGSHSGSLLLGLTEDVDCAVVQITTAPTTTTTTNTQQQPLLQVVGKERKEESIEQSHPKSTTNTDSNTSPPNNITTTTELVQEVLGFTISHITSVPALAYIAAGKLAKKFITLSSPQECCTHIAAAVVESKQYVYLYRKVEQGASKGYQQVVEVDSVQGGAAVLGATLCSNDGSSSWRLLLLTSEYIIQLDL